MNFDTADCHVIGGCDLYTTKAAGTDKKLYKNIEHSLESQYESLLRLSAALRPTHASSAASSLNLSRSSPFGPLSQISSRRTFAYLIATLNASHPDYDFSHLLRPTDFRRERSVKSVMNVLNTTLYNLRPRTSTVIAPVGNTADAASSSIGTTVPPIAQHWGPRMWSLIHQEMNLRECSVYCYAPEEDPYDGEEGAIWSFNYFFFNKAMKRVCYIYLRGLSVMSHVYPDLPTKGLAVRGGSERTRTRSSGANKRANYWLGEHFAGMDVDGNWDEDDDDVLVDGWEDDEVDVDGLVVDDGDEITGLDVDVEGANEELENERDRGESVVWGVVEDNVETMEV